MQADKDWAHQHCRLAPPEWHSMQSLISCLMWGPLCLGFYRQMCHQSCHLYSPTGRFCHHNSRRLRLCQHHSPTVRICHRLRFCQHHSLRLRSCQRCSLTVGSCQHCSLTSQPRQICHLSTLSMLCIASSTILEAQASLRFQLIWPMVLGIIRSMKLHWLLFGGSILVFQRQLPSRKHYHMKGPH